MPQADACTSLSRRLAPALALMLGLAPLLGPTQTAVVHADGTCTTTGSQVQCTFEFTGGAQTWTAPAGVSSATFEVYGAQGGGGGGGPFYRPGGGGLGSKAVATLSVTPGAVYQLVRRRRRGCWHAQEWRSNCRRWRLQWRRIGRSRR